MPSAEILAILLEHCVSQGVFVQSESVDPNADLVETGQVDSMGLVQLQALIEELFGVSIPGPVFVAELRTLARIAAYLEREERTQ
jgi:acyl carrier protein